MKLAIVGSRDYPDEMQVRQYVANLPAETIVLSGGARGVDTWAVDEALKRWDLTAEVYPAEWQRYGKSAGYRRNADLVNAADQVVAFWDGRSSGTKHTIKLAQAAGKLRAVYQPGR